MTTSEKESKLTAELENCQKGIEREKGLITYHKDLATVTTSDGTYKYVLNTNTKKIHYADCKSVNKIKDKNKAYTNDYDQAIADGYTPCGNCHPVG